MIFFGGRQLDDGIDEVSEFVARSLQGVPGQPLDPEEMPDELERLTVLVTRLAERPMTSSAETSAKDSSTHLDEIIASSQIIEDPYEIMLYSA